VVHLKGRNRKRGFRNLTYRIGSKRGLRRFYLFEVETPWGKLFVLEKNKKEYICEKS